MDLKETMIVVGGFLLFFGMLFFTCIYEATMKEECRLAAIEQNYTAVEIQFYSNASGIERRWMVWLEYRKLWSQMEL